MPRDNHKSVVKNHEITSTNFRKVVKNGFQFPVAIEDITKFKRHYISSVGIATQNTIDEFGHAAENHRHTH